MQFFCIFRDVCTSLETILASIKREPFSRVKTNQTNRTIVLCNSKTRTIALKNSLIPSQNRDLRVLIPCHAISPCKVKGKLVDISEEAAVSSMPNHYIKDKRSAPVSSSGQPENDLHIFPRSKAAVKAGAFCYIIQRGLFFKNFSVYVAEQ